MTEEQLQASVAQYLDLALPAGSVWFHVPNGGSRNKIEAAKLKRHGVKAGVADCIIIMDGQVIAIELKTAKGRLSAGQKIWRDAFQQAGGHWHLARSLDDVQKILKAHRKAQDENRNTG